MIQGYSINNKLIHHTILPYSFLSDQSKVSIDTQIRTLCRKGKFDHDYDDVYIYKNSLLILKLSNAADTLFVNLLGKWKISDASFVVETMLGHLRKITTFVFDAKNEMLFFHSFKHRNISRKKFHIYHSQQTDIVVERSHAPKYYDEELLTKFKVTLYNEDDDVLVSKTKLEANISVSDHYEYLVFAKPLHVFLNGSSSVPPIMPLNMEFFSEYLQEYISFKSLAWKLGYTKHNLPFAGKYLSNCVTKVVDCNKDVKCVVIKGVRIPKFPNDNPVFDSSTTHILQEFSDWIV